jgi:hypothetical protein
MKEGSLERWMMRGWREKEATGRRTEKLDIEVEKQREREREKWTETDEGEMHRQKYTVVHPF